MGPESAEQVKRLAELTRQLQDAGLIDTKEGRLELTPAGLRRLGQNALVQVFRRSETITLAPMSIPRPAWGTSLRT